MVRHLGAVEKDSNLVDDDIAERCHQIRLQELKKGGLGRYLMYRTFGTKKKDDTQDDDDDDVDDDDGDLSSSDEAYQEKEKKAKKKAPGVTEKKRPESKKTERKPKNSRIAPPLSPVYKEYSTDGVPDADFRLRKQQAQHMKNRIVDLSSSDDEQK
jgi:hypothetical protein